MLKLCKVLFLWNFLQNIYFSEFYQKYVYWDPKKGNFIVYLFIALMGKHYQYLSEFYG